MHIPFHVHSSMSLLDGVVKPDKIAKRCKELGYTHCMLTDHGNVSNAIVFAKEMEKRDIVPILGIEFYCSYQNSNIKTKENRGLFHTVVAAKNKQAWKNIMKAVSASNHPDNFYYKPRLDLKSLSKIIGDSCFVFSGHPGSYLWDMDTEEDMINGIQFMKELFGDNLYLESQKFMQDQDVMKHISVMENASKKTNTKIIACQDIHYTNKEDAVLQRVVLASNLNKTIPSIYRMDPSERPMGTFFNTDKFYLHSVEELKACGHTDEELDMSCIIDQLEPFKIQEQPKLPKFSKDEAETLKQQCRDGWKKKHKVDWDDSYVDRVKEELGVFERWDLCGYILIVADYIKWAKSQGMIVGPGRGSSGGSLVCYLTDITEIDPMKYNLFFSRFFNEGRCSKDNVSLPDIDTDFPTNRREEVIQYLRDKYGKDYVCQIATYGTLKGRGAIKEVFRMYEVADFDVINEITKAIPDEADIADELEEQGEESIISWCLRNQPKILQDYCYLKDGELVGQYAEYFKIAIELEGIHKSQGKHAAGVIVSSEKLSEICPLIYDKNGEPCVAFDKKGAEIIGLVKLDILGVAALDKLKTVNNLLRFGTVYGMGMA